MFSEVEIVNIALARLSNEPIASMTENSDIAKMVRPVFGLVFRRFLSEFEWSFATRNAALNKISVDDERNIRTPLRNGFALPTDFIKIQEVFPSGFEYEIMQYALDRPAALFIDANEAGIRYTASSTLAGDLSPAAVDALSCLLAAEITLNMENSTQRAELCIQRYQAALEAAKRDDLKSRSVKKTRGDDYFLSRFSCFAQGYFPGIR